MARVSPEAAEVNARILYWGIEGAGKRTTLRNVATRLRPDHRGELAERPTRFDPSVSYTVLPIELGEIGGMRTRIELIAVPGSPEQAPTRKQLLDEVDGIVFVVDAQRDRLHENAAILEELRKSLADYARPLDELPLVVQYNKRDLSDAYGIDDLHRRLGLGNATVFESVATQSTGLLQTLSTISKKVIRALRGESLQGLRPGPAPPTSASPALARPAAAPAPAPRPAVDASAHGFEAHPAHQLEEAILAEGRGEDALGGFQADAAREMLAPSWEDEAHDLEPPLGARLGRDLAIVSVGEARRIDARSLSVPLVLGDGDGETSTLVLTIRLDPLLEGEGG